MKPAWMTIAEGEIGVHETPGPKANERITAYHATTTLRATSDEVPWCSSFVNWCIKQAGLTPTRSAAAKSWLSWGEACLTEQPGAIAVIRQKRTGKDAATGSSSGYHVAFFVDRPDPEHIRLLGGNQGDSVKYSTFPLAKYALMDLRWPTETPELPEAA